MMIFKHASLLLLFLSLMILVSCIQEDDPPQTGQPEGSGRGLFIVNEGNFTYENASLTYYDIASGEVTQEVFFNKNQLPLGDVAVSMHIRDSLGYVVVNNSGRIYILNTRTFAFKGKITGLTSPRNIHFVAPEKAYVTDLYSRAITIVNPVTMEITGSMDVSNQDKEFGQHSTEQMVQFGSYVYTNCWSYDNQVLIIDSETDRVVDSVEVIKQPNSMVLDKNHALWVLSDGGWEGSPFGYETPGMMRIAASATEADPIIRFSDGERPAALRSNGAADTLYFINRHIYRMPADPGAEPEVFIESPYEEGSWGGFYGLSVDPVTSEVYVTDALDFSQPGVVYRYSPAGIPVDTFQAGIVPGAMTFTP